VIRAALVPYLGGSAGLVIAEGDSAPVRLALAIPIDVGKLVPLPEEQQTRGRTMMRRIDEEDLDAVVETVMGLLCAHGVSSLTIEATGTSGGVFAERGRAIGSAVGLAAEEAGIVVARAARSFVSSEALEANFLGWPSGAGPTAGDTAATRAAGALLLKSVTASRSTAAPIRDPSNSESAPAPVETAAALAAEIAAEIAPVRADPYSIDPATLPEGRRAITIDPGSRYIGVVVAVGDVAPLHAAWADTLEIDSRDWASIVRVAAEIAKVARHFEATVAVVERALSLYLPGDSNGAAGGAAKGTRILRSGEVGATIALALELAGLVVLRPTAGLWRSRLTGKAIKGEARWNAIGEAVRGGFRRWEGREDDAHRRDAGGMALWAAIPLPTARPPKAKRPPGEPGAPREKRTLARRRSRREDQASRREAREAVGCQCGTRHKKTCPLAKTYAPPAPVSP
jgi:hypothetical protein